MEMDSKLLLSDLRAQDVDGAAHHPIKMDDVGIDDVAQQPQQKHQESSDVQTNSSEKFDAGQQKLQELSLDHTNSSETFDVERSDDARKSTIVSSGNNNTDVRSDGDLDETTVSVGVVVTTVEPIDHGMIDFKPDPPLSISDEDLNASSCSLDIVDVNVGRLTSSDIDATTIDDKAAPDPPEFSNVLFDADSSIVRLHHDERVDDTAETTPTIMKELDPPEYSNVIFDADASIVRLHFEKSEEVTDTTEQEVDPPEYSNVVFDADASIVRLHFDPDGELSDGTTKKKREPDPPESTSLVYNYDSSFDKLQMEQEPEAIAVTTQGAESDTQEFSNDLHHSSKLPTIEEAGAEDNGPILLVAEALDSSAILEETPATAADQMEVACSEQIDTKRLIKGECDGVEVSSDVDHAEEKPYVIFPVTETLDSSASIGDVASAAVDQLEVACPKQIDTEKLIEGECGGVELSSDVEHAKERPYVIFPVTETLDSSASIGDVVSAAVDQMEVACPKQIDTERLIEGECGGVELSSDVEHAKERPYIIFPVTETIDSSASIGDVAAAAVDQMEVACPKQIDTEKLIDGECGGVELSSDVEHAEERPHVIFPVTETIDSSAIIEDAVATAAVDQMEVACPAQIDAEKLIEGVCGGFELSSDVEHNPEALPTHAIAEANVTVSSSAQSLTSHSHCMAHAVTTDTSKINVCTETVKINQKEASNMAASTGSSDEKKKTRVTTDTSLPSEINVCSETVIFNDRINAPEEKTGSTLVSTAADSSGKYDAKEVGVAEGPCTQLLQSSFATFDDDDDDCSYEEIIVDDDDEFIEYVDEILEDDFTEVTCESENGADADFILSNNASFNGTSSMEDLGYKRPVIKSATQKALEKEVAIKTAAAEEVMQNMRFKLARQNSFCRKDDEYRRQLEMEEAEHLRLEELEEAKRVAEHAKQALSEKANHRLAQSEEDEIRRQEWEAAQEKAATEKLRREVEEKEKMERNAKRKAMEEEVKILQTKLAEAKVAAEQAKKKESEEKKRLKAKVDAHRREKRRTSIADAAQGPVETASTGNAELSTGTASHAEPIASMPVMSESIPPPTSSAPVNTNTVYYPVDALRQQSIPGLDYKNREIYIHPDEFQKLFQMSIAEFNEQPKWKRTNLKRKLKLF